MEPTIDQIRHDVDTLVVLRRLVLRVGRDDPKPGPSLTLPAGKRWRSNRGY